MSCDFKKCVSAPQSGHCKECVISFETHNMAQSTSTIFYQDRMPLQIKLSVKFINLEISLSSLVRQSAGTDYPLFESIICRVSDSASRLAEPRCSRLGHLTGVQSPFSFLSSTTESTMKVLVCGGRDYADRDHLNNTLDYVHQQYNFTLLIQSVRSWS